MAKYYAQLASAGLIVSEAIQPGAIARATSPRRVCTPAEQTESWKTVTDAVHAEGGVIFAQLMHSGRIGHPALHNDEPPVPPSAARLEARRGPRPG
jgi:N-ethylmaleimide reductase